MQVGTKSEHDHEMGPYYSVFWTSLAPFNSWYRQLFNSAKLFQNRALLVHFMAMFWFCADLRFRKAIVRTVYCTKDWTAECFAFFYENSRRQPLFAASSATDQIPTKKANKTKKLQSKNTKTHRAIRVRRSRPSTYPQQFNLQYSRPYV